VEVAGVRAKNVLDITSGHEKVEWTVHLVVRNFSDNESGGTSGFVNLASPLKGIEDQAKISSLPWAWPMRTELKLESPAAALGMYGVNYQPISLKLKDRPEIVLNCRYCALAGQKLDKAIDIDGELNDWPENPGALAGNFLQIRPDGVNEKSWEKQNPIATVPTTVSIGYTAHHLYFAFTCFGPKDRLVTRQSNTVASSTGLPWGEDLVTIVLDPENSRSFNPLDLYQVIVKANGTTIGLRGTVEAGKMGAVKPWHITIH